MRVGLRSAWTKNTTMRPGLETDGAGAGAPVSPASGGAGAGNGGSSSEIQSTAATGISRLPARTRKSSGFRSRTGAPQVSTTRATTVERETSIVSPSIRGSSCAPAARLRPSVPITKRAAARSLTF